MNADKLNELYEKLYFHEIDMREKLNGRLQLPLAILISVIGVLAFMFRSFGNSGDMLFLMIFIVFYLISLILIALGVSYFIKSWYGYEYSFIPSAIETERYRQLLIDTYKEYDNNDELVERYFSEYLMKYYIECSSNNTDNNDKRSLYLHFTNKYIVTGAIFAFLSFIPYYFGGFDKNQRAAVQSVRVCEPIEIKGAIMSADEPKKQVKNPPPPPPPPPKRLIREGVEITPQKKPK